MNADERRKIGQRRKQYLNEHPEELQRLRHSRTGAHVSKEVKRKMSQSRKQYFANNPLARLEISKRMKRYFAQHPAVREKLSSIHKGKPLSEEHRKKLSKAHKQYFIEHPEVRERIRREKIGRHPSIITRQKLSIALTGKPESVRTRQKISRANKGKHRSEEAKERIRKGVIKYIREYRGGLAVNIGKHEKQILDALEVELGYRIIRQYEVGGYFLDGYIPEINLAIEVDEKFHTTPRHKKKDAEREEFIKQKLGCRFLRIKD